MYYIYKLNCKDGVYVGMTSNLKRRLWHHKSGSNTSDHPYETYEVIAYTCSRETAYLIEDLAIRKYGTINRQKSGLYSKNINAYHKKLYKENPEYAKRQRESMANLIEGEKMMFGKTTCRLFRRMFK